MSCASGYSAASSTDNTCLRDCAKGYYAEGYLCWPECPDNTVDIGPQCNKTSLRRIPLRWTTDETASGGLYPNDDLRRSYTPKYSLGFNGSQVPTLNGDNSAGCAPYFATFISSEVGDNYQGGACGNNTKTTKCFVACPKIVAGSGLTIFDQTYLNATGSCLPTSAGLNDWANVYAYGRLTAGGHSSPYDSTYYEFHEDNLNSDLIAMVRYPSGEAIANAYGALTNKPVEVSGPNTSSTKVYADRGVTAANPITRSFDVPVCNANQKAEFFDSNGAYVSINGVYATLSGTQLSVAGYTDLAGNRTPKTISVGTSQALGNYQNLFQCRNLCPSGTKRYGDYCMPDCPNDGSVQDLSSVVTAVGTAAQTTYNSLITPSNDVAQRRCLKTLSSRDKTVDYNGSSLPDTVTATATTCPAGTTLANRWKATTYTNPALYQLDTSVFPSTKFMSGGVATNKGCFDATVCTTPYVALGFIENVTAKTIKVICGRSQNSTCSSMGTGFTTDETYANMCLRPNEFVDPFTSPPDTCLTEGMTLMGQAATLLDNTFALGGYKTELNTFATTIAASTGVYSPIFTYNYGDVVSMGTDEVEFYKGSQFSVSVPFQKNVFSLPIAGVDITSISDDESIKTFSNKTYGRNTGPFFRCTQQIIPETIDPSAMVVGKTYVIVNPVSSGGNFTPDFTSFGAENNLAFTVFTFSQNNGSNPASGTGSTVKELISAGSALTNNALYSIMDTGRNFDWSQIGGPPSANVKTIFKYSGSGALPTAPTGVVYGWVLPCTLPNALSPKRKYLSQTAIVTGKNYVISSPGTTDFTALGSLNNNALTSFYATSNGANLGGTGLVLPSADYDYSSLFVQDPAIDVAANTNSFWTAANIPTKRLIENNQLAGVDDWQGSLCQPVSPATTPATYNYCPPLCTQRCPGPFSGAVFGDPIFVQNNTLQTLKNVGDTTIPRQTFAYADPLSLSTAVVGTLYVIPITMDGTASKFNSGVVLTFKWKDNTTGSETSIFTATNGQNSNATILFATALTAGNRPDTDNGVWKITGTGQAVPSYVGYYEPTFDFGAQSGTAKPPTLGSKCYLRCGSSGSFTAQGRYCISQTVPQTLNTNVATVTPGFSWCPAPSGNTLLDESNVQYEQGGAYDEDLNVVPNQVDPLCPPKNNCLTDCPPNYYVDGNEEGRICVTKCPQTNSFIDLAGKCVKIPYTRTAFGTPQAGVGVQGSSGEFNEENASNTIAPVATQAAKFALSGGTAQLYRIASYITIALLFIVLIMILSKYNIAKST